MKPKQISAHMLLRMARKRKVVFFGAGKILDKVFQNYQEYHFENAVDYIVDNNQALWGTVKKIGDRKILICSAQDLRKRADKKTMIVIMIKEYGVVVQQLSTYKELKHTLVYLYPECHYLKADCLLDPFFAKLPLRNMILFQGEGDNRENALALYEYMQEHDLTKRYKTVWLCDHPERFSDSADAVYINRNIYSGVPKILDIWKSKYYYYVSRYLFYENKFLYKKRKAQVAVYLKHGTFMLKDVKRWIQIPSEVNWAVCTSYNYADLAVEQEGLPKEKLLICGSPRLDFLYKEKDVLKRLKQWEPKKKYILWLPTLRQTKEGRRNDMKQTAPFGIPLLKSESEFEMLESHLAQINAKLVMKPHPHQDLSVYKIGAYQNIVFLPQDVLDQQNLTIHSLMREMDALISDYSSIAFDYMLLDRPIAYAVDDMEDYKVGFSVENPFDYMPGEKLYTWEDLLRFLDHVKNGVDLFGEQRRAVRDYVHDYQDNKNSERFLKMMKMC